MPKENPELPDRSSEPSPNLIDLSDLPDHLVQHIRTLIRSHHQVEEQFRNPEVVAFHSPQPNRTDDDRPLVDSDGTPGIKFQKLLEKCDDPELRAKAEAAGLWPPRGEEPESDVSQVLSEELSGADVISSMQEETQQEKDSNDKLVLVHKKRLLRPLRELGIHLPDGYEERLDHLLHSLEFDVSLEPKKRKSNSGPPRKRTARVSQDYRFQLTPNKPQNLSRSRIELFRKCQRCFVLRQVYGLKLQDPLTYKMNIALDILIKKELDAFREAQLPHPVMVAKGMNAYPLKTAYLDVWRENFKGMKTKVVVPDEEGNKYPLFISGAVDDVWVVLNEETKEWELRIVDYKSTYTEHEYSLDDKYKEAFKRQLEIYTYIAAQSFQVRKLLEKHSLSLSQKAHILLANGVVRQPLFVNELPFTMEIFDHECDTSWVEPTLKEIIKLLVKSKKTGFIPQANEDCTECLARDAHREILLERALKHEAFDVDDLSDQQRKRLLEAVKHRMGLTIREAVREILDHYPDLPESRRKKK